MLSYVRSVIFLPVCEDQINKLDLLAAAQPLYHIGAKIFAKFGLDLIVPRGNELFKAQMQKVEQKRRVQVAKRVAFILCVLK